MFLRNTLRYFLTINSAETVTVKAYTNTHSCIFFRVCFFREMLEATAILSASFNLFCDSLSGRWCVCGQYFVVQRHISHHVRMRRAEKKKRAITMAI